MAVPDDFSERLKRQILGAYGFDSEAELDAATEEALPGYLAAEAEYRSRLAAYTASLPDRVAEAQQTVTELLRDQGMLPDGVEFELAPMDLQADPQWMAQAPWAQQATAAEPSDVLARIDAAIDDWESGPDAARWNPDVPDEQPQPQYAGLLATLDGYYAPPAPPTRMWIGDHEVPITGATWTEVRMETRPAPYLNAGMVRMASEFNRQSRELTQSRGLGPTVIELTAFTEAFTEAMRRVQEAARMLTRALGLKPCKLGAGPCSCHPKPFPAARDYRRRTRHRNRRRKS